MQSHDFAVVQAQIQKKLALADALGRVYDNLLVQGGICQQDVITLENHHNGILTDDYPKGGFSKDVSLLNYHIACEKVANYRAWLVGGALIAILGFLYRMFGGSSNSHSSHSGGGGSYSSSDNDLTPKLVEETLTEAEKAKNEAAAIAAELPAPSGFNDPYGRLVKEHENLFKTELRKAGLDDNEIDQLIQKPTKLITFIKDEHEGYLNRLVWSTFGGRLYKFLADTKTAIKTHETMYVIEAVMESVKDRFEYTDELINLATELWDREREWKMPDDNLKDIVKIRDYYKLSKDLSGKQVAAHFQGAMQALKETVDPATMKFTQLDFIKVSTFLEAFATLGVQAKLTLEAINTGQGKYMTRSLSSANQQLMGYIERNVERGKPDPTDDPDRAKRRVEAERRRKILDEASMTLTHLVTGLTTFYDICNHVAAKLIDVRAAMEHAKAFIEKLRRLEGSSDGR